jgi:aminopeptidase N
MAAFILLTSLGVRAAEPMPRHYARDRDFQVRHLALDVTPDFRHRSVSGTAVITFAPNGQPLEEMSLDAVDLRIQSVGSTEKIAAYNSTTDKLTITFDQPIPVGRESRVTIVYSAEPRLGLYFRTPELGYKAEDEHVFSQGEAIEARHWYPCFDAPNEKFTSEITCHAPADMTVLSNGRLVAEEAEGNGQRMTHWSQDQPHANYLITLVAGHFKKWEDHHGEIPLPVYTPPSDEGDVALTFRDTRDVMEFYEQEIGEPFPWPKYGQVVVQDFVAGGMENTSLTTLTDRTLHTAASENLQDSDGLIAHEMAHQWFGDLVTCKDWSQLWLNESFATFYAELYNEHKNGADADLYAAYGTLADLVSHSSDPRPIVNRQYEDPNERFDYLIYPKGGFVLRMLRAQLGVALYRQCIKTYLERHKFGNVVTEDLASVVEELSGRSYEQFFDQWIYHGHFPELEAHYAWDQKTRMAKISVRQTQKVTDEVFLFEFPFTVSFGEKNGSIEQTVNVKEREAEFYFPLPEAPRVVTLDPHLALLAKIDFPDYTVEMARAALEDSSNLEGRLRAVEKLRGTTDLLSVEALKRALQHDACWGVRHEAAGALLAHHSEESLAALLDSRAQTDARVRRRVMECIAGFYEARAFAAERTALASEANPNIAEDEIRALGRSTEDVRALLLEALPSHSYHNTRANGAIAAMRARHDESYLPPLIDYLTNHATEFNSRDFGAALDTVAVLGHGEDNKDKTAARECLLRYVNDRRQKVQLAAIKALGVLEDPRGIPALETFALADAADPRYGAATNALAAIRAERPPAEEWKELRDTVLDLQKTDTKLRGDVDGLKKQWEAQRSGRKKSER